MLGLPPFYRRGVTTPGPSQSTMNPVTPMSDSAPSLFAPFAAAIRDGHVVAYSLPAKPEPLATLQGREHATTTNPSLAEYYDRPNAYSGD
jgi:hypothetical protein